MISKNSNLLGTTCKSSFFSKYYNTEVRKSVIILLGLYNFLIGHSGVRVKLF